MGFEKKSDNTKKIVKRKNLKESVKEVKNTTKESIKDQAIISNKAIEDARKKQEQEKLKAIENDKKCIRESVDLILNIKSSVVENIRNLNANRFCNKDIVKSIINSASVEDMRNLAVILLSSNAVDNDLLKIILQKIDSKNADFLEKARSVIVALNSDINIKQEIIKSIPSPSLTWSQIEEVIWGVKLRTNMISTDKKADIWSNISKQWNQDKLSFNKSIESKTKVGKFFARIWRTIEKIWEWLANKVDDVSEKIWISSKYESDDVYETIVDIINPNPPKIEFWTIYASADKLIEKWNAKGIVDILSQLSISPTLAVLWWAAAVWVAWISLPLTWLIAGPLFIRWVRQDRVIELLKKSENNFLYGKVLVEIEKTLDKDSKVTKILGKSSKEKRLQKHQETLLQS